MLEQLTWPIVFALFPSRKPDASPLDPDCTIRACNKACKAGLFVFFQAGCANGNDPRLRHYSAKCPPYLSFGTNAAKDFQPSYLIRPESPEPRATGVPGLDRALSEVACS